MTNGQKDRNHHGSRTATTRRTALALAAAAGMALAGLPTVASAQDDWPNSPITLIVPFDAGGSADRMARGIASFLPDELGVPVLVLNKPGAGGQLGHTYFLQQPDDGNTLLFTPATPYIANNILMTGADFTMDDFAFINAQWADWTMIATPADRPYQTLGDLIEAIKANPGKLSTGSTFGSAGHLSTIVLLEALGLTQDDVRIVNYSGGGPLRTALAGGQIDFSVVQGEGTEVVRDMIWSLAAFLEERNEDWDVPPINEALEPYGVKVPLISGSIRTLAASASFKEKHPDRFQKLVDATQSMLSKESVQKYFSASALGADWLGPEKSTELLNTNFQALVKYKDLLQQ